VVHFENHAVELPFRDGTKVKTFGEYPPQPAVRVFVLAALPRTVWVGKKDSGGGIPLNHAPECELASTVVGDDAGKGNLFERCMDAIGGSVLHQINSRIEARAFDVRQQSRSRASDNGVALP